MQAAEAKLPMYTHNDTHAPERPADWWFQKSNEGLILFIVFYTKACRWSRCLGCNLPSLMSSKHVPFQSIMSQIDYLFARPEVKKHHESIRKVILSNNGSILDEETFSSTALMYLLSQLNIYLPNLAVLSIETRPEYVEMAELEFISRALAEGETPTSLELALGFEAFDDYIRNEVFHKGLSFRIFENLAQKIASYNFNLKCYFMQKPVPLITDEVAVNDIRDAINYLSEIASQNRLNINIHLNPTYVAKGTMLEEAFLKGEYQPPFLKDVARAACFAERKPISMFIGLSDEGLAVEGGSFFREGDSELIEVMEEFNVTQDFNLLKRILLL